MRSSQTDLEYADNHVSSVELQSPAVIGRICRSQRVLTQDRGPYGPHRRGGHVEYPLRFDWTSARMGFRTLIILVATVLVVGPSLAAANNEVSIENAIAALPLDQMFELPMPKLTSPDSSMAFLPPAGLDTSPCSDGVTDWFVSTRNARQDWCDAGCCDFSVFRRENGGILVPASLTEMQAAITASIPTVIFVHGSFVQFDWLLQESRATTKWLRSCRCGRPINTIHFTWPSDRDARYLPSSIRELTRRAEFNAFYLAELMAALPIDCHSGGRLTLIGHSHGGLMAAAAMHLLGGGAIQGHSSRSRIHWRANVVLAAAAFDRDWLTPRKSSRTIVSLRQTRDRGRYDRALNATGSMLILKNRHDFALALYPGRRLFARQAIGKTGLFSKDEQRMGTSASRIREVDVTKSLRLRHTWPHYLMHHSIACAVAPYVYGG